MPVKVFGHTLSTPAATAIGGGSLLAVYFAYKQHKASTAASASATSPTAIDPVTGLPYSQDQQIDPLTGQAYLAEAQQYGSVSAAEQAVAGESSLGYTSAGGYGYGSGYGAVGTSSGASLVPATTVQGTTYASNAAWAQAVEAGLTDIGYTSTDVAAALGRYLSNLSETPAQATIVQAAIAEYGPPPVGSFQVIMASTTPSGGSGGTAPSVIKVAPSGFRVVSVNGDNVNLAWNPVPGATGYVIAYGPTSGSQQYKQDVGGQTTEATVPGVGGGKPGKHYFELWATPAATGGPHAGPIEATTK